jgi:hypothetical protein
MQSPYEGSTAEAFFGMIRNNILSTGRAQNRFGLYEDDLPEQLARPITMTHNLVTFPAAPALVSAVYRAWDGSAGVAYGDFASLPAFEGFASNLVGDPMLGPGFHLTPGSPCLDTGTTFEASLFDMDGEPRPAPGTEVDIGPDELHAP